MADTRIARGPHAPTEEGRAVNEATAIGVPRPTRAALSLADANREHGAWQEVLERLHTWRAERMDEHALAVVVARGAELSFTVTSSAGAPAALIVGRHTQCDAHVDDPGASLRHAAVLLWPSGEKARAIAIDLASGEGLHSHRGLARRVASETALRVRVGDAQVFALVAARDAPFAVRWRDELEAHVRGALVDEDAPRPPPARADWERSMVVRTAAVAAARHTPALVVQASADELARGVMLGRYERCRRTTAMMSEDHVSRVHALLFAADDALWLVDTASTHGSTLLRPDERIELGEGRRIARVANDARVFLADVEVGLDLAR